MPIKQLIACMSKAKGDAKKIAACKSSFAKKVPPKKKGVIGDAKKIAAKKGFIRRVLEREFATGDSAAYANDPSLVPPKWRKHGKPKKGK